MNVYQSLVPNQLGFNCLKSTIEKPEQFVT